MARSPIDSVKAACAKLIAHFNDHVEGLKELVSTEDGFERYRDLLKLGFQTGTSTFLSSKL